MKKSDLLKYFFCVYSFLFGVLRVTPSLPQRGRQPKGVPSTPPVFQVLFFSYYRGEGCPKSWFEHLLRRSPREQYTISEKVIGA
jgi:hypothetical protein